jgi:uncharacterized PurR-regulated membrane protein YhhQ (DUF165 family)
MPVKTLTAAAVALYAAALVLANLLVANFNPAIVAPINAFVLIGLDLSLRDWLHMRLRRRQMLAVIVASGVLTYLLNPTAGPIALASAVAFLAAACIDWAVFALLKPQASWLVAANYSNGAGALVDSVVFLALAPFPWSWPLLLGMFAAKVAGGAVWAAVIARLGRKAVPA